MDLRGHKDISYIKLWMYRAVSFGVTGSSGAIELWPCSPNNCNALDYRATVQTELRSIVLVAYGTIEM